MTGGDHLSVKGRERRGADDWDPSVMETERESSRGLAGAMMGHGLGGRTGPLGPQEEEGSSYFLFLFILKP